MYSYSAYFAEASNTLIHFLPRMLAAIILWFAGSWLIVRFVKLTIRLMVVRSFDISLQSFVTSLLNFSLKVLLLFSIAGLLGIETSAFLTALGAAGLAIGLSLQGSLSNFAGGVLILTFKPFKVGDIIEAQGQTGRVKEIRILHTLVQTGLKKIVYIPNGILSNGVIINSSSLGVLVFDIRFDVDRSVDIEKLRSMVLPVMKEDDRIYKMPAPALNIAEIGGGITLSLIGTADIENIEAVKSSLRVNLLGLLLDNSIIHPQNHSYVHQVNQDANGI